jgi:hypothetical protein
MNPVKQPSLDGDNVLSWVKPIVFAYVASLVTGLVFQYLVLPSSLGNGNSGFATLFLYYGGVQFAVSVVFGVTLTLLAPKKLEKNNRTIRVLLTAIAGMVLCNGLVRYGSFLFSGYFQGNVPVFNDVDMMYFQLLFLALEALGFFVGYFIGRSFGVASQSKSDIA